MRLLFISFSVSRSVLLSVRQCKSTIKLNSKPIFSFAPSWRSSLSKMAQQFVDDKVKNNKVVVFSKTYCPFCKMAKTQLNQTGVKYDLIELDERADMEAIQDYLLSLTGARSVPRVFINGKCIGGGTETKALADKNELVPMLKKCGAL